MTQVYVLAPAGSHAAVGACIFPRIPPAEPEPVTSPRPAALIGKTVLVTGASSGIGRAIAGGAARAGADLVITFRSNAAGARDTAREVEAAGQRAVVLELDLTRTGSLEEFVATLAARGTRIDAWVNNAGADILTGAGAGLDRVEKLDLVLNVDVRGTVRASWAAVEHMRAGPPGGVILNLSWDHVSRGMAGENPVIYAAAKGAVEAFSRSLALDVAPHIRVNVLAPGFIETAFGQQATLAWRSHVERVTPLRRWGRPGDVAAAAVYLMSDAAKFVTGQTVRINGGVVT
jgi:3-oxoacyl-[acyl-carrier protein] reductase